MSHLDEILADYNQAHHFSRNVGLQMVELTEGLCRIRVEVTPFHGNRAGDAHGGLITTLADSAIGMAVRSKLGPSMHLATIELKVQFLQPGRGVLEAVGKVLRTGRSIQFGSGEIFDASGSLIAFATGTFKLVPLGRQGQEQQG